MNPSSPVTGATISGLTSPTYTLVADLAPANNGKQWYVSTLGGTQTGASAHSTSSPFTVAIFRPNALKQLGAVDQNGQLLTVPKNTFSLVFRKGMVPLSGQPAATAVVRVAFDIPAGVDLASPVEVKALLSMVGGFLFANGQGVVDAILTASI